MQKMDIQSKESSQRHYFLNREHDKSEYFSFDTNFKNQSYKFNSCNDVFSKEELDYGSLVLVNSVLDRKEFFSGKILDMCCGYGTIGILLSKNIPCEFDLCDINTTAVELAKENVKQNNCVNIAKVFVSDLFENVNEEYDHIVSNPPIKVGKDVLLRFLDGSYKYLKVGGTLTIVIKKNLGADSTKKYMTNLFGNAQVWERDKGYYILHSKK